jgi:catechol 2,3-dioxygenase-like lactoylglutathione lyase family enzyme
VRVRFARHTDRLEEVVAFYRDRVGLPELGRFAGHDGYDGVFLDLGGRAPGDAQLEFTTGGGSAAPAADDETLLVLYLDSEAERDLLAARIGDERRVIPANPYWRVHGIAFADPDGFQLILALDR